MHLLKVKLNAARGMLTYDAREPGDYVNPETHGETLHPERTGDNYALTVGRVDGKAAFVKERPHEAAAKCRTRLSDALDMHVQTTGKKPRKDAVGLGQWCVTLPKDVPREHAETFFTWAYSLFRKRYGAANVPAGFVHMDESQPHMHVVVLAMQDKRFQAKNIFNRKDLQTIHKDFQDELPEWAKGILLDDDDRLGKALSKLDRREMNVVKEHIRASVDAETAVERGKLAARENALEKGELALKRRLKACEDKERSLEHREAQVVKREEGLSALADKMTSAWVGLKNDMRDFANKTFDEVADERALEQRKRAFLAKYQEDVERDDFYKPPAPTTYYPD